MEQKMKTSGSWRYVIEVLWSEMIALCKKHYLQHYNL